MEQVKEQRMNGLDSSEAETIDKALKLLDGVVKNHKIETSQMEKGGLKSVNDYMASVESKYRDLQKKAVTEAKRMGSQVDQTVHDSPWYFIAGAAVTGSVLGIYLNNKMRGLGRG